MFYMKKDISELNKVKLKNPNKIIIRHINLMQQYYFLPLSSQKFLVLILSTLEGLKAESTLEPPSGFEHGTPGLAIQHLNH